MKIRKESAPNLVVFRLEGRLDALTGPSLVSAIALDEQSARIVLDMQEVTYVSSGGLRAIVQVARRAQVAQGGVAMFGLQPSVREVFDVSGFGNMVPIASDEAEARSKLGLGG